MAKRILFLCYWSLNDGLTKATVFPRLRVLQHLSDVVEVVLITVEREPFAGKVALPAELNKVVHQPLISKQYGINILTKISDFIHFPKKLMQLVEQYNISVILAHGAPAGALAYKVWQKTQTPFYVSSFEPHADYMLETGVWNRWGLKYLFQKRWEELQKKWAAGLMPVAENYKTRLVQEGVAPEKVSTVPCSVDFRSMEFSRTQRDKIRKQLGWQHALIGIYVGKYGGLYYQEEAFRMYKKCFELIADFRLIILSPQENGEITQLLQQQHIDLAKVVVTSVPHHEVPAYLSAADFAFATYKANPAAKYLSPIKIGEYWASGLPVLLTEGVGDDSDIIKAEGGGALFNVQVEGSVEQAIGKIQVILKDPQHREQIPELAKKYRSPERIKEAYEYIFARLEGES
ncbi:glycosyltransferase [Botryobacter ruber]|uniref:glycosyltransferase n=1 Tax=Botryobacter ruber TaxID=2171629 RepID=UPI0013E3A88B|nr:glycosyltransferase [Botryobacter ruber]